MPTIIIINGYRFKFFSNENDELPHIHITKGSGNSKYWLQPKIEEEYSYGFTVRERRDIKKLVQKHSDTLLKAWYEKFNKSKR